MTKISINGTTKKMTILSSFTNISVKEDLYSAWKNWSILPENLGFLPAMRAIGGDPIGGGKFAGDIYFLMNGWKIVIDHAVEITGVLYHDDGISVFEVTPGGSVVSIVSSIVQTVESGGGSSLTKEEIAETTRNEIDENSIQLALAISKLDKLLNKIDETQAFVLASS